MDPKEFHLTINLHLKGGDWNTVPYVTCDGSIVTCSVCGKQESLTSSPCDWEDFNKYAYGWAVGWSKGHSCEK